MRPTHAVIALAFCLSIVHAHEQQATFDSPPQQQQQQQQSEEDAWQTTPDDYPLRPNEPPSPTADQVSQAKSGLHQIMAALNVKHVEPLFSTLDGYCTAFKGLCTAACAERIKLYKTQDRRDGAIAVEDANDNAGGQEVMGCVDPQAQTVASAGALCQCAGYDMTDRINFAVVGGIVSSEPMSSSSSDFAAQGILDSLTNLPVVHGFLSFIHVLQNVCYYAGLLDILATNPHPATCSANPLNTLTGMFPGLAPLLTALFPGLVGVLGSGGGGNGEKEKKDGGIGDVLHVIFGGGQGNGGQYDGGDGGLGAVGDVVGGIINGGNTPPAPLPIPDPMPVPVPVPVPVPRPVTPQPLPPVTPQPLPSVAPQPLPPVAPQPLPSVAPQPLPPVAPPGRTPIVPTPSPKPRNKLFGLFSGDRDNTQEASGDDRHEVEESRGADRLVSHDGRVAKIVKMKSRGQAREKVDKN